MKELYDLLIPYIKKHKKYFIFLNLSALIAAIFQTAIPLAIGYVVDEILPARDASLLLYAFLALVGFAFIDFLAQSGQRFSSVRVAQNVLFDIRQDLYKQLQELELDFYARETTGQIMSRSIEEVFSLRNILTWSYRITILVIFLFLGALISMLELGVRSAIRNNNYGPFLLAGAFLIIPMVMYYVVTRSAERNREIFYNTRKKFADMSDQMAENLSGIQSVKAFGNERDQVQIFNKKNQEFFDAALKGAWVRGTMQPGIIFITSLALVFLVFVGGWLVSIGSITAGNFITFMLLSLQIAVPARFVGWVGIVAQDANSAAIRLNEIFDAEVGIEEDENAVPLQDPEGKIELVDVSFSYPTTKRTLEDINLKIQPGEKIALLGPTGAGKSTLVNLIPRFFDPDKGTVLIDDQDVKKYTLKSLRRHIGIVHQDPFLFTMTVEENIKFGKPEAEREEVIEAAKAAQIHDYIKTLDDGYDTVVGERGVTLSGGQRQRVTIARTILKDPKLLIFDDSVSSVDPKTESLIQENLNSTSMDRTTIIISQRPSSLRYVDRVVVMDQGKIVQEGTHEELNDQDGIYQEFINAVNTQVRFMDWNNSEEMMEEN